jgi:hypothetical protein
VTLMHAALLLPQALTAVTQMLPLPGPAITAINVMPCPVMVYPAGVVHE